MGVVHIGVGSNIDPAFNVPAALDELLARGVRVTASSRFYRTAPIGRPEQSYYANGVWRAETADGPLRLKVLLREVERRLGRVRGEDKFAPRSIDLDILLYDDLVIDVDGLVLPDPHILERPFLAHCLVELDSQIHLPGSGELRARFAARPELEELAEITRRVWKKLEVLK